MTTTTHKTDVLIIGSGMAGTTLVRELRKLDSEKSIHVVTADDGAQYSKPMLSNAFAQNKSPEGLVQKSATYWAGENDVTIMTHTRVSAINRPTKTVVVASREGRSVIAYEQLVLAIGASPRPYAPLAITPKPLPAVNSLSDYADWRSDMKPGERVLIIGAGLIGAEFANDLAGAGFSVDVVDPAPHPLGRLLPDKLGLLMQAKLVEQGVTFHMNQTVQFITDSEARLTGGGVVEYDHVLSAIGLVANVELAQDCELKTDQGIVVDNFMMTTDPHIYALGDCAQTKAGVLPYIQPLMIQARALARTLTDDPTPVVIPALPVVVKTPALPTVVCPPPVGTKGEWIVEGEGMDQRAVFMAPNGQILGFALTGDATQSRMSLAREVPDLLAA